MTDNKPCAECGHEKEKHFRENLTMAPDAVLACECCDVKAFRPADYRSAKTVAETDSIKTTFTCPHSVSGCPQCAERVFDLEGENARLVAENERLQSELRDYEEMVDSSSLISTGSGDIECHVGDRWTAEGFDSQWFSTAVEAYKALTKEI